jgi:mercuric ion transport protein
MSMDTGMARNGERSASGKTKAAFAVGGLLAAFAVASCCALPVALSALGISAAFMVGIGFLAAPYQGELLFAAMACLAAAGFLSWRQWQRPRTCPAVRTTTQSALGWLSLIATATALGLIALTFWIEAPL